MSMYFTDEVEITPVTFASKFREETLGVSFVSKAYVENSSVVSKGVDGDTIKPTMDVLLPKGTDIKKGYRIRIIKIKGRTIDINDVMGKQRKITMVEYVGGHRESHIEVKCTSGK